MHVCTYVYVFGSDVMSEPFFCAKAQLTEKRRFVTLGHV
jgi:hypothetical protein